jgi:nitronate monooxygenase
MLAPEAIRRELETIRAGTAKPCNVNFFCHVPPQPAEPGANASR